MFNKDEKGHHILIIKYLTSSSRFDILDIEEICLKDLDEHAIVVKFKPEKKLKEEKFKTNEASAIIKVFKEYQTKAYQQLDIKKSQKEEKEKAKKMGKGVDEVFNIF
jgi:hypothetical protein